MYNFIFVYKIWKKQKTIKIVEIPKIGPAKNINIQGFINKKENNKIKEKGKSNKKNDRNEIKETKRLSLVQSICKINFVKKIITKTAKVRIIDFNKKVSKKLL